MCLACRIWAGVWNDVRSVADWGRDLHNQETWQGIAYAEQVPRVYYSSPGRRRNSTKQGFGCRCQSLASIIISFIRLGILGMLGIVWADLTVGCRLLCGVLQVSWSQVQPFR